jgi:hypothetical protein
MQFNLYLDNSKKNNLYVEILDRDFPRFSMATGLRVPEDYLSIVEPHPPDLLDENRKPDPNRLLLRQKETIEETIQYVLSGMKDKNPDSIRRELKRAFDFVIPEIKKGGFQNLLNIYKATVLEKRIAGRCYVQIHLRYIKKNPKNNLEDLMAEEFDQVLCQEVVSYYVSSPQRDKLEDQLKIPSTHTPFLQFVADHNNVVLINKQYIHSVRFEDVFWQEEINEFESHAVESARIEDIFLKIDQDLTINMYKDYLLRSLEEEENSIEENYRDSRHFIVRTTYNATYDTEFLKGEYFIYLEPEHIYSDELYNPVSFVNIGVDGYTEGDDMVYINCNDVLLIESGTGCHDYFNDQEDE